MQGPQHLPICMSHSTSRRIRSSFHPHISYITTLAVSLLPTLVPMCKDIHRDPDSAIQSQPLSLLTGRVILLNGFPGVGKFSIGRRLFEMFNPRHARFIDNHLLIDPVQAIAPGRGSDRKTLRRAIRQVAFDALCAIGDKSTTLILTSCLSTTEEDQQVFEEYLAIASRRNIPFYLFNIFCDTKQHHSRLVTTERSTRSKTKLINPEVLDHMLDEHKLVDLPHVQTHLPQIYVRHIFELDTTYKSIDESAAEIYGLTTGHPS